MEEAEEKKRQVWLSTKDEEYEKKLCRFLGYHYGNRMEVHRYEEYLQGAMPVAGSLLLTEDPAEGCDCFGRTLRFTQVEEPDGIALYQSGHKIARQILSQENARDDFLKEKAAAPLKAPEEAVKEEVVFGRPKNGKVYCVYSPVGGVGKTSFAMALAQCLHEECEGSVLFLSMEGSSAWPLYYRSETQYNLSDLLYCLLMEGTSEAGWNDELERVVTRQENGVYFIRPCSSFQDLNVLTPEETERFFSALLRHFSRIVCDLNTACHSVNRYLMAYCSRVFLLSRKDMLADYKVRSFQESMESSAQNYRDFMAKTRLLVRGRGKGEDALPEEKELFKRYDAYLRLNTSSAYYKRIRQIVQEELALESGGIPKA